MKSPFLTLISFAIFIFPAPAEEKKSDKAAKQARKIEFSAQGTPPGTMKFAKPELKIKAGQPIELTFKNPDVLQHNLLILKPGATAKVGALADAMLTDPEAMKKSYIPKSEDILYSTKLVNPGAKEVLKFTIDKPGNYPIICTFPGHWRLMSAVLKVEK
ncbi:MAG: plastocyanin/azurin family copper-binding protein [Verrucomicrobiales bacterium]|nr:plastocyanin/azurin family copper-binding protein [Verrucomicrobiales bacterium]